MLALDSRLRGNDDHILFPVFTPVIPIFTPVIPSFTPVIPSFTPVIPIFTPVIPAKAGIQTDSPPEPYCPVTPWPCHAGEVGDPMLALDSRLRGNDDHILFPVFTPVIPIFTPVIPSFTPVIPSFTPVIPSFTPVIPAKAGIQTDSPPEPYCPVTPWPCHAGEVGDPMLALDSRLRGNDDHILFPVFTPVIPSFTPVIPSFTPVIPVFTPVIPAKAGIQTDSPPEPYCPVTP
ncbi:hypothetical protein [Endozoicomonas sp. ALB032]|uniref:hypothetical protein n=1 Tax=Endozoicomonas sp. ALB032 TaxID=3403082 RepID=UPI003BB66017